MARGRARKTPSSASRPSAAVDHLIGIQLGMGTLDDMNHLKNQRIRSVADLLKDQFGLALARLENQVRGTICGAIRHQRILGNFNFIKNDL